MDDELYDDEGNEIQPPDESSVIRDLRKQVKEGKAATKELEAFRRENALLKSGVNLNSDKGPMFRDLVLSGAVAPDQVLAKAEEYGLLTPAPPPEDDQDAEEIRRTQQGAFGADTSSTGALNAAVIGEWSRDKRGAFKQQHPAAYERIRAGETVTGISC